MTSSNIQQILTGAAMAPTGEVIKEEVIVTKEVSVDNLIFGMVELASYLYQLKSHDYQKYLRGIPLKVMYKF